MKLIIAVISLAIASVSYTCASDPSTNLRSSNSNHRELNNNYGECEGDCSDDDDCAGSLRCLVNFDERYNNFFPGCSGEPPKHENWCYDPGEFSNKLFFIGNEGKPSGVFPLDKCRGDCDTDSDCKGNLKCYERYDETSVPGCTGITATDGVDYCYDPDDENRQPGGPEDKDGTLINVGNPPGKLLKNCEGDCDKHEDCDGNLLCFQREGNDDDSIPGCKGVAEKDVDYCYDPSSVKVPGGPEKPDLERIFLDKCQGDCDDDDDCKGSLECYQNLESGDHPVPGCSGLVKDSTDYCYDPSDE